MKKAEIMKRLLDGEMLDEILPFREGQGCLIFKSDVLSLDSEVVYIPDTDLNEIHIHEDLSNDADEIIRTVEYCYTGKDFLEICGGDINLADELFREVDWCHPSTAYPEIVAEREEMRARKEARSKNERYADGTDRENDS